MMPSRPQAGAPALAISSWSGREPPSPAPWKISMCLRRVTRLLSRRGDQPLPLDPAEGVGAVCRDALESLTECPENMFDHQWVLFHVEEPALLSPIVLHLDNRYRDGRPIDFHDQLIASINDHPPIHRIYRQFHPVFQ